MKRITLTMLGLLVLAGQAAFAELKSGTKAPGFRFLSLSGETVALTTQEERLVLNVTAAEGKSPATQSNPKAVLLHFFQPACQVCQKEMAQLQKLHEKYGKEGLVVLGIARSPMESVAKRTRQQLKLTYDMLKGAETADLENWDTPGCPAYVVDTRGVIRFAQTGFTKGDEKKWEQTIQSLLNAATPPKQK